MTNELLFGIAEGGIMHTDADEPFDLETKFRMVKEAGVYEYYDKTPPADQAQDYLKLSERYDLPVLAGGWYYTLGRDEALLEANLRLGGMLGSRVHNTQIMMDHADGHLVTDEEVAETYLRAYEVGEKVGCFPTFEIHINMWSEDFRRVIPVADLVESRGVPYRMTLDHSHVMFKIDNPGEREVFGLGASLDSGELVLDPFKPGSICDAWIDRGLVGHAHARAAVPNNPRNVWAHHPSLEGLQSQHPKDTVGRGIQFPFIRPEPGQWHSEWDEERLEPWKEVIRHLMAYHATTEDSPLSTLSTEFIPYPDYGGGAKYSIFENSVACAKWLHKTWAETVEAAKADAPG
ncbi:MAG: hypothetical protein GY788_19115 [bacterium]|nr:hypothetical protein [bacterium]